MQGAKHSDAHRHREHLQRRSAPTANEPNVQVIAERALRCLGSGLSMKALRLLRDKTVEAGE